MQKASDSVYLIIQCNKLHHDQYKIANPMRTYTCIVVYPTFQLVGRFEKVDWGEQEHNVKP